MKKRKSMKKGAGDMLVSVVGGAAAGLVAVAADKYLVKNVDPLYTGIGMVAIGAAFPAFVAMKGVAEAGAGLIAVGSQKIADKYLTPSSVAGMARVYQKSRFSTIGSPQRSADRFLEPAMSTISGTKKKNKMNVID